MTGRFLIMLVVLTAVVTTAQPAAARASEKAVIEPARSTWIGRRAVGLSRSITQSALLHRIAFGIPKSPLRASIELDTHPVQKRLPDPFRYCLPPPGLA
ncbi:MAG: hypothetical protein H7144_00590 [Burkholderiales bacterium]|nr:hypothetical protein [Phycisphaerae bacterium]